MHTIFAQATARGKAGVAIIRVSGPEALEIGRLVAGNVPSAGRAAVRYIRNSSGETLDQALVLFFEGPASFTGEDVVEFQLHGSRAVVKAVEATIEQTGLARLAEAGEFTHRALMNDRLDLAQVEGLSDLIEAETETQRKQAMRVFSGGLSRSVASWREMALRAAALLEAGIDFADEEVPVDVLPEVADLLATLQSQLVEEIEGSRVAERVRDGFEVAILGAPNAGKSTLLNALAGREIAITSEIAGTTRDVIEARMDVRGLSVTFLDTAGVREAESEVERIGVKRAISRALDADLRVVLLTSEWIEPVELWGQIEFTYVAKADLHEGEGISGLTGLGIDRLIEDVSGALEERVGSVREAVSERQRNGMVLASSSLSSALDLLTDGGEVELVAEELRQAVRALDSVIGRIDVEAVLGEIFSRFCIGK